MLQQTPYEVSSTQEHRLLLLISKMLVFTSASTRRRRRRRLCAVADVEGRVDEVVDVVGEPLERAEGAGAGAGAPPPVRRAVHVRHAQAQEFLLLWNTTCYIH